MDPKASKPGKGPCQGEHDVFLLLEYLTVLKCYHQIRIVYFETFLLNLY